MDKDLEKILKTEYSEKFDDIRKKMMIMSYYKYGLLKDNYDKFKCMDAIGNMRKIIEKYIESGACEVVGFGINEIRNNN